MKFTYRTVVNENPEHFDIEVNKAISEGWQLYGSPYHREKGIGFYCQAMTKEQKAEEKSAGF